MGKFKEFEQSAYQAENNGQFTQPSFVGLIELIKNFSLNGEEISESEPEEQLVLKTS